MKPIGPFDLTFQNQYFNPWPTLTKSPTTIVMAFPAEGWQESAAVTLKQLSNGNLDIQVYGATDSEKVKSQALASLSLDEDGDNWVKIGDKDPLVKNLQEKYHYMRPALFHSGYEAAAAFIIGHRITIAQARKIRANMAQEFGEAIEVEGEVFHAFPDPHKLLKIESYRGLNATKIERLHSVAQAALENKLDRKYLRSIDEEEALKELETLPGIGPFFSQGILYRGIGIKDGVTKDTMSLNAIKIAYNLPNDTSKEEILRITEKWQPYRMWVMVLLHVWLRETKAFEKF